MDHQECESVNKVRNRFRFSYSQLKTHKCSYRSMEVKLPALLGIYDRQTDQPTDDRRTWWLMGKLHFYNC